MSQKFIFGRSVLYGYRLLLIPAVPGIPEVTAEYVMGSCALNISWIVPDNIAICDITGFMIYIDGVNVYNVTNINNDTFLSMFYPVRSCALRNVSVSAVNRCHHEGQPSSAIMVIPEPFCEDLACMDDRTSTSRGDCKKTIYPFINIYYCLVHILSTCFGSCAGSSYTIPGYMYTKCDFDYCLCLLQKAET